MPLERPTDAPHRLDEFAGHLVAALRELRTAPHPGAMSGEMSRCCRAYLGRHQRKFMLAVMAQAAEQADVDRLGFILGGPPPFEDVK